MISATWLAYLVVGWLVGGAASAILPRDWPTGDLSIGHETAATTPVRHPNLRMTKAAFAPFQNATVATQAVTSTPTLTVTVVDEPPFLITSYVPYTKTISLVDHSPLAGGKATADGESPVLASKTVMENESGCHNENTITITITEAVTVISVTEVTSKTTKSIVTVTSATKQPTLSSTTPSEPSPTAGSIIRIPMFNEAQVTKVAAASHSIGPGLGGWNASTFVTASASEAFRADSLGYDIEHMTTTVPASSMQRRLYERQAGVIVTAMINGKVVLWKNEWSREQQSFPTSIKSKALVLIPGTHVHKPTRTGQVVRTGTSATGAAPTSCGETGFFNINFDDLPAYSPGKNQKALFPPIFSPYHHFFFSSGWSYGPPPAEPFAPVSNPHIGIHVPTGKKGMKARSKGQFGGGPRAAQKLFWFDAFSAQVGCDTGNSTNTCNLTVKGLKYSAESGTEIPAGVSRFEVPPCIGSEHCSLTEVLFGDGFSGLSGIEIDAQVAGKAVLWYIDDIQLRWHDDTCAAGIKRQRSQF